MLVAIIVAILYFAFLLANFYLLGQWLIHAKLRRRFLVCRPFLALGWALFVLGLALNLKSRISASQTNVGMILRFFAIIGSPIGLVGMGLTVFASLRLLRANAAERRRISEPTASPSEGIWPPPPDY